MKIFNNVISVFVIAVILLIIIPLNPVLLDMMFIINISLSLIILLLTMYIKEALQFSIFPTLLLITTLFRLSLNISSTRLILLHEGQAGQVIATFGNFVLQGEPVVGFVIFLIIVVVQFVVITKGSERVAEVSARFTLDAMPGKQMAIDADLSSGLIDEQTARKRRSDIQREAEFYGSMDGASKFVKGDAIVAIIIAVINLLGGTVIGLVNGGSFADVLSTYTIATVGDGLVSQLPALLISTATGMIVTRAASESDLNTDMTRQFFSQPIVLIIAGGIVAALMLIPGFPWGIMLMISLVLIGTGITLYRRKARLEQKEMEETLLPEEGEPLPETEFYKDIDNVYTLLNVEQIEIEFGYSLIPLVDEGSGGTFVDRVVMFRKQFALDMGMVVPAIRMRENSAISPNQYVIKMKGEDVASAEILTDHYLALDSGNLAEEVDGIDTVEPAFNIPAKWISQDRKMQAEIAGYTLIDPTSVIITHLSEVIKAHAHELLTRQEVNRLLDNIKKENPVLVEETVPTLVTVGELQKVLANLLREGIPIRDMESILETVADYAATVKDADMLTEYVRQALKRTITHKFAAANQLRVLTLDTELENLIMGGVKRSEHGSYLAIDPDVIQKIVNALLEQINKVKEIVPNPIVLTSPIVRVYFKKIADQFCPNTYVLSFNEIDNNVQIQALGNIAI